MLLHGFLRQNDECIDRAWTMPEPFPPLKPLPPLPPLEQRRRRTRRMLSWATLFAVASAVMLGMLHGVGSKIADEMWPEIKAFFSR